MFRRRSGFTLIELLVVIAIIAILAAILFPIFAGAKERGRQAKCMNNLRQLSTAFQQYVDDNGGMTPRIAPWCGWPPNAQNQTAPDWSGTILTFGRTDVKTGSLWKYVHGAGVYICPTDVGRDATGLTSIPDAPTRRAYPLSYSLNQEMNQCKPLPSGDGYFHPVKFDAAVAGKSRKVLLFEHESRERTATAQGINDGLNLWHFDSDNPDKVHYDGTTVSYADGHAKWVSFGRLRKDKYAGDWVVHGSTYTTIWGNPTNLPADAPWPPPGI